VDERHAGRREELVSETYKQVLISGADHRFDGNEKYLVVLNADPRKQHRVTIHFTNQNNHDAHAMLTP